MTTELKTPSLPESVADATVLAWLKQPGEACTRDEVVAELETDKVTLTVHAPADGKIVEIIHDEGATVESGEVLGTFEEGAAGDDSGGKSDGESSSASSEDDESTADAEGGGGDAPLSPAVRNLLEEHKLDADDIKPTGKDGRLTKGDVLAFVESGGKAKDKASSDKSAASDQGKGSQGKDSQGKDSKESSTSSSSSSKSEPATSKSPPISVSMPEGRVEERVPMTRLRKRIAERLKEAQNTAAMLTTYNEVDLAAVKRLRAQYADKFEKEHGVRLGYMSFFVKACIEALKKFPAVNAAIDGDDIIYHGYFDVGVAVSTEKGLVVPILRDADVMTFADIEKAIVEYGKKAKEGSITIEEMTGGTFSITNGGVFGSMMSSPILNPPQSGILGMHSIQDRPVVEDGEIVVRPMMYLALSYDHRIVDGREAVSFLVTIKEALQDPARLLLQI